MPRITVFAAILALTLVGVFTTGGWPNVAARIESTASHPIVGAWYWENISTDPFDDSYAIFHADGTYVEETSYIGAGIGSWEETGERTGELIIVFQDIDGGLDPTAPSAFVAGTITFWLVIEVDESGDSLTATGPVEIRSSDGTLVSSFTFEGTATHLAIGRDKPVATPVP